uniref:Putative Lon protease (S16) C-terminal proteolytic domain protein n=1 Tax=uncultured marine microorganism HF4000_ANIW137I15 TaxID=455531 RepID=B3T4K6_9ZZZZ|nr:putative Lon protease (S16) C-terminal proteolytic domain protein [uncultured marine microorganism HF4000_ANIW137I15]
MRRHGGGHLVEGAAHPGVREEAGQLTARSLRSMQPAQPTPEEFPEGDPPAGEILPIIPLRDIVVFPHIMMPLFVGREKSLNAVEQAMEAGKHVALTAQRDAKIEDPGAGDLFTIGTRAEIVQAVNLPEGAVKMLVEGLGRIRIQSIQDDGEFLKGEVIDLDESAAPSLADKALARRVIKRFEQYLKLSQRIPPEVLTSVENAPNPGLMADTIAGNLPLKLADRVRLLEDLTPVERMEDLLEILSSEIEVMTVEREIRGKVKKRIDRSQKEYYLTEQMKAIQEELGAGDDLRSEVEEFRQKVRQAKMPAAVMEKTEKEIRRLESMPPMSAESAVVRNYLDWLVDLPWAKRSRENLDLAHAEAVLKEDHHGLEKVKERILEYLAVRRLVRKPKGPILCLVGPPGVGKTSLGRSIARATHRKFARISLGGIRDEAEIRGHRRTYIGSLPGRIIQSMHRVGTVNPVLMLDEIDKLSFDFRGDPTSALLEVLDPEQNKSFSDHYLEVDYDLSQVFFIATANVLDRIPPTLRDRLEILRISGYTEEEKLSIARKFLLPKEIREHGLKPEQVRVSPKALQRISREYTREAGVRNLERELAAICRKAARRVATEGGERPVRVHPGNLKSFLGVPRHRVSQGMDKAEVGVATGLAWTENGGELLLTEIGLMPGTGKLTLTGQLGEVLQESARAAVSFVRARADELDLLRDFSKKRDIHIHVPEGSIPKDGPSAGVTIVVALVSALTGRRVRNSVCMTGEITLRGKVLAVGGIKEKVLAAHRAGYECVILPKENERDLDEIPQAVRRVLRVQMVDQVDEIFPLALMKARKAGSRTPSQRQPSVHSDKSGVRLPH